MLYQLIKLHSVSKNYIIIINQNIINFTLCFSVWFGVIFPRYGLYKNGVFRFRLLIDSNWPNCDCPKVIFETPLFHPLVDASTGEMNTQYHFPEWKKGVSRIWHVIDHVSKSFYDIPRTKTPENSEAAEL